MKQDERMPQGGATALVDPVAARRAIIDRRRALLDAARLFSCAVALGGGAAVLASILLIPLMIASPGLVTLPVLAAAFAGAGGAAAQLLDRTRRSGGESGLVAVAIGSVLGALAGLVPVWLIAWASRPEPMATVVGTFAALFWVGGAVAIVIVARAWSEWRAHRVLPEPGRSLAAFLAAVVVASAAFGLLAAAAAAAAERLSAGPEIGQPYPQPVPGDADSGFPGEAAEPPAEVPSVDEARRQFAALAQATAAAAGPDAIWTDPQGPVVTEAACEGGVLLTLDGEFAMGVITDTTTDEHDREVTEGNLDAAERIGAAWHALGLGQPEPLHGEEHFGGGALGSVEHAEVGFAFGVAQPRIDGRCVPLAG